MPDNSLFSGNATTTPSIPGFNPGDEAMYLRQQDGHMPGHNGILGANHHVPGATPADFDDIPTPMETSDD